MGIGNGGRGKNAEGNKMDFRTKQETITAFYMFPSKISINLTFLLVCVCECREHKTLSLKCKSDFTTDYNIFTIQYSIFK